MTLFTTNSCWALQISSPSLLPSLLPGLTVPVSSSVHQSPPLFSILCASGPASIRPNTATCPLLGSFQHPPSPLTQEIPFSPIKCLSSFQTNSNTASCEKPFQNPSSERAISTPVLSQHCVHTPMNASVTLPILITCLGPSDTHREKDCFLKSCWPDDWNSCGPTCAPKYGKDR